MTIPKQLMIGSVPYDVEVVKGWLDERENGEVRIAEVTYHEQKIKISDNVAKHEGQMKNVLHEAIHAMLYEYGLDRLNKEANVNALTTVFFDFIKNNIRGGVSSFVGHEYLVLTSPEKQVEKEEQHGFSFINTAAELVKVVNQHPPEVDVSALGAAMANAEVRKAVDLGVTHEQIQESVTKMTTDKQTRKLPIVDVNRSSFPVEEIAKITKKKETNPTHWKTGIKYDDGGKPRYRTRYECCMCGNRGNQYEYEGNKFTKCHKCNAKLKIVQAMENGFPERDTFGNFYVANDEYSVILDGE
ncbi:hypothetical protein BK718_16935 [Bacillus thuringiensis serovar andalousiensis]|uniref:Uncharacterized protein n=1 Tax=Bacillus thuringiensis TaxID=1428 RepID=A0A9X6KE86_BACTU|nr:MULTISPECIES: hypothetical protein [Bacillus cereus group]MDA2612035.1 hypothetical protein [Bacillus cereus]MEB8553174.1 hypothetical protein [Bacillus cereus]MEB8727269.1 hypothetical protein [Bacillus cereus]MEB8822071.1 hypothetical protein [Bacillus cereus]MEB8974629.1 hypothetical protein [Bacillus cereus]